MLRDTSRNNGAAPKDFEILLVLSKSATAGFYYCPTVEKGDRQLCPFPRSHWRSRAYWRGQISLSPFFVAPRG